MATLTASEPRTHPSVLTRPCVGLLADSVSVRRLRSFLAPEAFEVVSAGARVQALLDGSLVPLDIAVVVGDPGSLGRGGAVASLRNLRPELAIVFVCKTDDRAAVRKALRAGVQGYVRYANLDVGLEPTLQAVLAGQLAVPQTIRTRIAWGTFSLREKQVLQLVAAGLTNSEIACRLFLSESTVKSHLSSSFRKLGVSSRAEAAAAVLDPDTGLESAKPQTQHLAALEHQLLGCA